ncbi:MAG: glutamate cyclase domain-containing protein [Acidobacteriota bacterium]
MIQDGELRALADQIDHLVTLDVKKTGVRELYQASRARHQASPTLVAAQRLAQTVKPMDPVLIMTGVIISPFGTGETDGPIGAAGLARALALVLKARPLLLTTSSMLEVARSTLRAAGLNVISPAELQEVEDWMRGFAGLDDFPVEDGAAQEKARRLIGDLKPSAVISVETTGPNSKGVYHNYGRDFSSHMMKSGRLFEEARRAGVLTIGIGDRGNEIGFGSDGLHEAARGTHPYGKTCRCPCGEGAADVTAVDITVVATVSNWGAYGMEAALAAILQSREALHDGNLERRMLEACSRAGGVDGRYQTPDFLVDSMPEIIHVGIVELLSALVAARVDFGAAAKHDPYGKGKY